MARDDTELLTLMRDAAQVELHGPDRWGQIMRSALEAIRAAGYVVTRPHDWEYPKGWPWNDHDPVKCRRCGQYKEGLATGIGCDDGLSL